MGLFDSVWYDCPCGGTVEWQSKAGDCYMGSFSPTEVPVVIAADLSGESRPCDSCGAMYRIYVPGLSPKTVPMVVERI